MARTSPFEEDDPLLPSIVVVGIPGDDNLEGSGEDDRLVGRRGNDNLTGLAGDDRLIGGRGLDELRGGPGDDLLRGGANADELYGDEGDDVLRGGSGRDRLEGEAGNDALFGGGGRDFLRGGSGSDLLIGGRGVDELVGRSGFDRLDGGRGFDTLAGGPTSDVFQFTVLDGKLDRIIDFEAPGNSASDALDLSALVPISTTDANLSDFVRQTERADGKLIEVRPADSAEFVELALITRTDIPDLSALQLGLDDIPGDVSTEATLQGTGTDAVLSRVQQTADQDWFRIELLADRDYAFDLQGATAREGDPFPNGVGAPVLELRDADGALMQADADGGAVARLSLVNGSFDPGTYYLVARGAGSAVGDYELTSTATFIASDPGLLPLGEVRDGVIAQDDQLDLYRIEVEAGETYSVFIEATDPQQQESLDLNAVISDEDGLVVTAASLFGARFGTAEFEAEATETLTIEVSVSFIASPDAYRLGFNTDPPADVTTTAEIAPGETVFGEIGPEFSDEDWYRIELVAGRSYRFESEGIPGLDVRAANGDLLASDRAGLFGTAEIEFTASMSGTQFLAVLTESSRGSYALSANEVGGDPASILGTEALLGQNRGEAAQGSAPLPRPAADLGQPGLDSLLTAADPAQAAAG